MDAVNLNYSAKTVSNSAPAFKGALGKNLSAKWRQQAVTTLKNL